jgi:hypothetical protein
MHKNRQEIEGGKANTELNTTYGAVNDSPDENFTEITGGIERMVGVDDIIRSMFIHLIKVK